VTTTQRESARRILLPVMALALFAIVLPMRATIVGRRSATPECLALTPGSVPPDAAESRAVYERCLLQDPQNVELIGLLGRQRELAHDPGGAEALYRQALAIDPGYADLRQRLAVLLLRRGDAAGARREATTALESRPNSRALLDLVERAGAAAAGSPR
jgi:Flp pilus assembly protein TadD